jgi:hypothetical protein
MPEGRNAALVSFRFVRPVQIYHIAIRNVNNARSARPPETGFSRVCQSIRSRWPSAAAVHANEETNTGIREAAAEYSMRGDQDDYTGDPIGLPGMKRDRSLPRQTRGEQEPRQSPKRIETVSASHMQGGRGVSTSGPLPDALAAAYVQESGISAEIYAKR